MVYFESATVAPTVGPGSDGSLVTDAPRRAATALCGGRRVPQPADARTTKFLNKAASGERHSMSRTWFGEPRRQVRARSRSHAGKQRELPGNAMRAPASYASRPASRFASRQRPARSPTRRRHRRTASRRKYVSLRPACRRCCRQRSTRLTQRKMVAVSSRAAKSASVSFSALDGGSIGRSRNASCTNRCNSSSRVASLKR